jgi:hypothetical protein
VRHFASMKALLCTPLLFASYAFADEAAERIAIGRAITALNEPSQHGALFTDGRAYSEFEGLRRANPLAFKIIGPAADPESMIRTDEPTVAISHETWGEATINLARSESRPSIAFITPDVALAEGAYTYEDNHATKQTTPLLIVMKKEGYDWKIASIRVLARGAQPCRV